MSLDDKLKQIFALQQPQTLEEAFKLGYLEALKDMEEVVKDELGID